jgi:hypothetical protein
MKNFKVKEIEMQRTHGYGQYKIVATVIIDGKEEKVSFHNTDSPLWDWVSEQDNPEAIRLRLLKHIGGKQAIWDRL